MAESYTRVLTYMYTRVLTYLLLYLYLNLNSIVSYLLLPRYMYLHDSRVTDESRVMSHETMKVLVHTSASKINASTTMVPAHVHQMLEIAMISIQCSSSTMAPACSGLCALAGWLETAGAARDNNAGYGNRHPQPGA